MPLPYDGRLGGCPAMKKQDNTKHYHFIGIGGIGMSALANILLDRGSTVSGSDLALSYVTEMLIKAGARVSVGHAAENIKAGMTVIYATGVSEANPEILAAKALNCPLLHRTDLLIQIAQDFKLIAVSGTHGKTTTSALLSHVLLKAEKEPAFAVGGILPSYGRNGGDGNGAYFVIEACESDGTFLKYRPYGAIVTNIDADHLDHFGTEKAVQEAFFNFIDKVSNSECLFWCGDDPHLKQHAAPGISYGFEESCQLRLSNFTQQDWEIHFDVEFNGLCYRDIMLPLIGRHNALNAAAVFGCALVLGLNEEMIRRGFASFGGVKRRCEWKGEFQGMLFLDDYAHHPVELKTTLEALRIAVGAERRLLAIYQPHRYSRTRDCMGMFAGVFEAANQVILTNIYGAGESPIAGLTDQHVYNDLAHSSKVPVQFVPKENLLDFLQTHLQPNDVVVTLGAGDITGVGSQLLKKLQKVNE